MARNAEKAKSMLNRYWAQKNGTDTTPKKRPRFVAKVGSLKECEEWRLDVIKEISKHITAIQNPLLQESAVRSINDEINKLIREKGAWERHIRTVGGADYAKSSNQLMNDGGVLGSGGYRYFGVAKNLPGVRYLLDQRDERSRKHHTAGEGLRSQDGRFMRDVYAACDASYFGYDELFRSEYDDVRKNQIAATDDNARARYLAQEANAERRLRNEQIEAYRDRKRRRRLEEATSAGGDFEPNVDDKADDDDDDDDSGDEVAALSTVDVQAAILKRKKEALLRQYISKEARESAL